MRAIPEDHGLIFKMSNVKMPHLYCHQRAVTTWATCSIVFGLPTSGPSFFWCAVVAGVGGGYIGAKYGREYGESKGEVLYEVNGAG